MESRKKSSCGTFNVPGQSSLDIEWQISRPSLNLVNFDPVAGCDVQEAFDRVYRGGQGAVNSSPTQRDVP
jgi:hypothetical protein